MDVADIPFMGYASEPLASSFTTTIPRGLYITAKTGTPKNCLEDQTLCRLIQLVLGKDTDFTLTGQTNWQWAHFKGTIQNTAMKNSLPVDKVEIEIKVLYIIRWYSENVIAYSLMQMVCFLLYVATFSYFRLFKID